MRTYREEQQLKADRLNSFATALTIAVNGVIETLASVDDVWRVTFQLEGVPYLLETDYKFDRVKVSHNFATKINHVKNSDRDTVLLTISTSITPTDIAMSRFVNRLQAWHKELKPVYERAHEAFEQAALEKAEKARVQQIYWDWKTAEGIKNTDFPGDAYIFMDRVRDGGLVDLDLRSLTLEQAQHIINFLRGK